MVTADQVKSYVDDGFLVVDDLVDAQARAAIIEDTERFARGEYPVSGPFGAPTPDGQPAATAGDILAIHFPHWVSPVMKGAVLHPGVTGVVGQIAAAHLPHWDGAIKCMQSMLFVKPSGLPGQAWHQDERFIPTRDRSLLGAWIALDDATIDNGCLWVMPGSHRNGYLWPTKMHERPDEFDFADEAYGFDESASVPVEVKAGAVVFFNGYLLHRSFKNRSDGSRRALVNHYCNAWSLLPWLINGTELPPGGVALADTRMIVPIGADPYEWKGYEDPPGTVFIRPHTRT
jgi:phytanoyl-CoA hydroxylase